VAKASLNRGELSVRPPVSPCHIRATTGEKSLSSANTVQHAITRLNWGDAATVLVNDPSLAASQAEYGGSIPLIRSRRGNRVTADETGRG
jgi:hypothetical protein